MTLAELQTKKIVVLGLGVNHQALVDFFKAHNVPFDVIQSWQNPAELLGRLKKYEVVFRTPGLPLSAEAVQEAIRGGCVVYSQTKLFFDLCPAPIVGITGTKGKGTTASLVAEIFKTAGRKTWLAGNIGKDPFAFLDQIRVSDWVVLELSSFQLQDLQKSPHIAVVLKITPDHLDYHEDFQEYLLAKRQILDYQGNNDFVVLNYDQETTRGLSAYTKGQVIWNSILQEVHPGCYAAGGGIFWNGLADGQKKIMGTQEVRLLGEFNLENVTAAIAACAVAGVGDWSAVRQAVAGFQGLPHRLEFAGEVKGVKFYNDSFATTPETTVAAISAFREPLILIVGGSEKNSDYTPLARALAATAIKALVPIGQTGARIAQMARLTGFGGRIIDKNFSDMNAVVTEADRAAESGDIVLLSPASASFGMFKNYKERGDLFKRAVKELAK